MDSYSSRIFTQPIHFSTAFFDDRFFDDRFFDIGNIPANEATNSNNYYPFVDFITVRVPFYF